MNKLLTNAEALILGMLYNGQKHGYELDKLIKQRGVRVWADIGFSSIYYLLDKLEKKDLVNSSESDGKSKRTYSITSKGQNACKEYSKGLISQREANKNPFMVGLANSDMLSELELKRLLEARLADIKTQLEALNTQQEIQTTEPTSIQYLFTYSRSQIEAEILWIKQALNSKEIA